MARGPSPENQARQDQALAYLRDQGVATTGEIAEAVWKVPRGLWEPECRGGGAWGCGKHCPKVWRSYGEPYGDLAATRAALIRLQKLGLVERLDVPESKKAYWRADDWDNQLAKLLEGEA